MQKKRVYLHFSGKTNLCGGKVLSLGLQLGGNDQHCSGRIASAIIGDTILLSLAS
jgi:hypothetical protein